MSEGLSSLVSRSRGRGCAGPALSRRRWKAWQGTPINVRNRVSAMWLTSGRKTAARPKNPSPESEMADAGWNARSFIASFSLLSWRSQGVSWRYIYVQPSRQEIPPRRFKPSSPPPPPHHGGNLELISPNTLKHDLFHQASRKGRRGQEGRRTL